MQDETMDFKSCPESEKRLVLSKDCVGVCFVSPHCARTYINHKTFP